MNKYRTIFILFTTLTLLASAAQAQSSDDELRPVAEEWRVGFESITAADAINYITFLANDELEGRDTASHGMRIARNYAASLFTLWGIAPAGDILNGRRIYHQTIPIVISEPRPDCYLEVRNAPLELRFQANEDLFLGYQAKQAGVIEAPVVFAGYGITAPQYNYDDFAGIDVSGKIIVVLAGLPGGNRADSPFAQPEFRANYSIWNLLELARRLAEMEAAALIVIRPNSNPAFSLAFLQRFAGRYRQYGRSTIPLSNIVIPDLSAVDRMVPYFGATQRVADAILAARGTNLIGIKETIDSTLVPHSFELDGVTARINIVADQTVGSMGNVLAMLEGSDPELREEVIVIGAHLDHLGISEDGYVLNGADDNASGSAGILELAQAFALNPVRPRRTILFALWTGEEIGFLGSRYFVEFPTIPRENIVAYINLDMISRDWSLMAAERYARSSGLAEEGIEITPDLAARLINVPLSRQAMDLERIILEENDEHIGLFVHTRPSYSQMQNASDIVPFHRHDIPIAYFESAMHADFHRPSDTIEKINGEKMERIIRLVYLVASELAQMPERLPWVEGEDEPN